MGPGSVFSYYTTSQEIAVASILNASEEQPQPSAEQQQALIKHSQLGLIVLPGLVERLLDVLQRKEHKMVDRSQSRTGKALWDWQNIVSKEAGRGGCD